MDKKPLIGNERTEQPQEETPERLKAMLAAYTRAKSSAETNKERLAELLQRKSAKKWDQMKKAQMVRRYMTADQTITEATGVIDQIQHRLEQITHA